MERTITTRYVTAENALLQSSVTFGIGVGIALLVVFTAAVLSRFHVSTWIVLLVVVTGLVLILPWLYMFHRVMSKSVLSIGGHPLKVTVAFIQVTTAVMLVFICIVGTVITPVFLVRSAIKRATPRRVMSRHNRDLDIYQRVVPHQFTFC
jgi:hypothetical protein